METPRFIDQHVKEFGGDDESEIDEFFSLIKSYREARNRLMALTRSKETDGCDDHHPDQMLSETTSENKKKKTDTNTTNEDASKAGRWAPSFERGDFKDGEELGETPLMMMMKQQSSKEKPSPTAEEDGIDLSLSL